jgi:hypothetical protein
MYSPIDNLRWANHVHPPHPNYPPLRRRPPLGHPLAQDHSSAVGSQPLDTAICVERHGDTKRLWAPQPPARNPLKTNCESAVIVPQVADATKHRPDRVKRPHRQMAASIYGYGCTEFQGLVFL